jgi:hypothetical protein
MAELGAGPAGGAPGGANAWLFLVKSARSLCDSLDVNVALFQIQP